MSKKVLILLALIITVFTSCKITFDDEYSQTYKVEIGRVNNAEYKAAMKIYDTYEQNLNFKKIQILRDYLYEVSETSSYDYRQNVSRDELLEYLKSEGYSDSTAEKELRFLYTNGNHLLYKEYKYNFTYPYDQIWIYMEKE